MLRRLAKWSSHFESQLSALDWVRRIVAWAVVLGGGTVSAYLAKASSFFEQIGPVAWVGTGVAAALLIALAFYVIAISTREMAYASYLRALSVPPERINPVLGSFVDQVIRIHDLHLPGKQLHLNKQFKRCKFVGPGALLVVGGTYVRTNFINSGDLISIPLNSWLYGITVLDNCTVEDCEFYNISIMTTENFVNSFIQAGLVGTRPVVKANVHSTAPEKTPATAAPDRAK